MLDWLEQPAEPLHDPLWTANLGKRGKLFFHRPIAGSFSINFRKAKPGVAYTPGYADERGFPRPFKARQWIPNVGAPGGTWPKPLRLDRPAARFTRFNNILRAGPSHYEFFGMKVRITDEMRANPNWFASKLREGVQHEEFGVMLFAKNKVSRRSMHLGWMSELAVPQEGLATLLPKLEGIPTKVQFPINLPGAGKGLWFFGAKRASAGQINVFAPRVGPDGRPLSMFERTWRTPGMREWMRKNTALVGAIGVGVLAAGYALSRLGRNITTPETIKNLPYSAPYSPDPSATTAYPTSPDYWAQPSLFAAQMAYGQAGTGKPLNEIAVLNKPRHWAAGFEGSWLSGAWRRFHELLPTKTAIEAFEKLGASISAGREAAMVYSPYAAVGRGRYKAMDEVRRHYRSLLSLAKSTSPSRTELQSALSGLTTDLKQQYKAMGAPHLQYNPQMLQRASARFPALNQPGTAFHELTELTEFQRLRGAREPMGGSHTTWRVVHDELRFAQLYDKVNNTNTLKDALQLRVAEAGFISDAIQAGHITGKEAIGQRRYLKFLSRTGKVFEKGYDFSKEIQKGAGNVREYFPEGWIEGIRKADSQHGFDTMGGGPTSKAMHKKLTDFGSGRSENNENTTGVAAESLTHTGMQAYHYFAVAASAAALTFGGLKLFSKLTTPSVPHVLPDRKVASTAMEAFWHKLRLQPRKGRRLVEKWVGKAGKLVGKEGKPWKMPKHLRKHWWKYYAAYELAGHAIVDPMIYRALKSGTKDYLAEQKRLEGIRRADSDNSVADGISEGPMAKSQHTTLTDFGSGRHTLRQLTKAATVLSPSARREQAIGSGIRSQRRRFARLHNTSARPGTPAVHRNKSRAGT